MGLLAFVFVVPMIRQFRSSLSLSAYSFSISTNIIELFSELGFQIAPLTYTVSLIEGGISYRFGGTYLYGIFSFISGNIPFIGEISSNTMNNIRYAMPQAGIGYSQVAEAYYNFGVIGGFILMILFGFFLLKLEDIYISPKTSPYKKMFVALFTVELVNITRNNSGTFIIYICYILLLMGAVSLVSKHTIKYS